jgi:DNA polymerase I-like protein with 3'-5' exonuclease and polymerase domains
MRFAAHISGDPVFIESCSRDIHTANACILFPDGAELIRSDPKGKGARFRDIAKTCGFAVAYGAEAAKIFATLRSKGFDVSMDDVETMLDNLKSSYRVFYGWANGQVEFTRKHGFLRIPFSNRIRWVGHFAKPNLAFNTPIQGGVAGVMNKRLLLLEKRKTRGAKLIKYHYDAAIYETPVGECADMNRIIKEVWAEPIRVESNGISFVQPIDFKIGDRDSDF